MENRYQGEKMWIIPDGYIPPHSEGNLTSHESICILNITEQLAHLSMTVYFEDRDPLENIAVEVEGKRTSHVKTNSLNIPVGVPYALEVRSNVPVFVQYSRLDATQPSLALMSTMAMSPAK